MEKGFRSIENEFSSTSDYSRLRAAANNIKRIPLVIDHAKLIADNIDQQHMNQQQPSSSHNNDMDDRILYIDVEQKPCTDRTGPNISPSHPSDIACLTTLYGNPERVNIARDYWTLQLDKRSQL